LSEALASASTPGLTWRERLRARAESLLARHWVQAEPTLLSRTLQPLAWFYGRLARHQREAAPAARQLPVPLLVVGNFTAGGSGKTPTVIAMVQALQQAGHRPGVVSRGHGRQGEQAQAVELADNAATVGDEPLLIRRRTGAPVWVGRNRPAAARALCACHPEVDVLVSDDGLQHHALARQAELVVFDERGVGNGLLLPAGPLRELLPKHLGPQMRVLYTAGQASTPLPGMVALRAISLAWPLQAWLVGDAQAARPLADLRDRHFLAVAGLAAPEKFFGMLEDSGLQIQRLPLPDHFAYTTLPWPAQTPAIVTTEKDAVKLHRLALGSTEVWVVPLDLSLPAGLVEDLAALLQLQLRSPRGTLP
jgi:tetraacyldisaccharide 4'-kinase